MPIFLRMRQTVLRLVHEPDDLVLQRRLLLFLLGNGSLFAALLSFLLDFLLDVILPHISVVAAKHFPYGGRAAIAALPLSVVLGNCLVDQSRLFGFVFFFGNSSVLEPAQKVAELCFLLFLKLRAPFCFLGLRFLFDFSDSIRIRSILQSLHHSAGGKRIIPILCVCIRIRLHLAVCLCLLLNRDPTVRIIVEGVLPCSFAKRVNSRRTQFPGRAFRTPEMLQDIH